MSSLLIFKYHKMSSIYLSNFKTLMWSMFAKFYSEKLFWVTHKILFSLIKTAVSSTVNCTSQSLLANAARLVVMETTQSQIAIQCTGVSAWPVSKLHSARKTVICSRTLQLSDFVVIFNINFTSEFTEQKKGLWRCTIWNYVLWFHTGEVKPHKLRLMTVKVK